MAQDEAIEKIAIAEFCYKQCGERYVGNKERGILPCSHEVCHSREVFIKDPHYIEFASKVLEIITSLDYVQLDSDQSLPEFNRPMRNLPKTDILKLSREDMLNQNWKKVKK